MALVLVGVLSAAPSAAAAAITKFPIAQTPTSQTAVDFDAFTDQWSAFGGQDDAAFQSDMAMQHYPVTSFIGCGTMETTCNETQAPMGDGSLTVDSPYAKSASLFTNVATPLQGFNYTGAYIKDSLMKIPANTKIIGWIARTNTVVMDKDATMTVAGDRFTVYYIAPWLGSLTKDSDVATSASLFPGENITANGGTLDVNGYVGAYLSDKDGDIPANTQIVAADVGGNEHAVQLSANATATTAGDLFTISYRPTTADNYRTLLSKGFGVIFWASHGLPSLVLVERHDNAAECRAALLAYQTRATKPYPANALACPVVKPSPIVGYIKRGQSRVKLKTAANVQQFYIGRTISGTGIPTGAEITGINVPENTLTIDVAATANSPFGGSKLTLGGLSNTLAFTDAGIRDFFKSANSIVYGGSCFSITLYRNSYDGAGYEGPLYDYPGNAVKYGERGFDLGEAKPAVTYFGYLHPVGGGASIYNTERFFGELAGQAGATYGSGRYRWASVAFKSGGPWRKDVGLGTQGPTPAAPVFKHFGTPDCPACDTDLSPAVNSAIPLTWTAKGPVTLPGAVTFDTLMNTSIGAASVVSLKTGGCDASVSNQKWTASGDQLTFSVRATQIAGQSFTLQVSAAMAQGAGDLARLEGNQATGVNKVGPNGTDYDWTVTC